MLVRKYGADGNATDTVRVLRVPGFYHCKGKPVLVKLLECNGRRYTAGELAKAFPPIARKTRNRRVAEVQNGSVDVPALRSALKHLASIPHPNARHGETYADDYDTWVRFGLAIARGLGESGFSVCDEWARSSTRYPGDDESRVKWETFDVESRLTGDPITVGTIFHCAKRHGWSFTRHHFAELLARDRQRMATAGEVRP